MNPRERLLTVFRGGTPDRVPVNTWLSLRVLEQITGQPPRRFLDRFVEDPANSLIKIQEDLGFDPILLSWTEFEDEVIDWPRRFYRWAPEAFERWRIETRLGERDEDSVIVHRTITTPRGALTSAYRRERYMKWAMDHLVKEESDLDLLQYRPDPKYLDLSPLVEVLRQVGDRGLVLHVFPGVWYEACSLRYLVTVTGDLFDRPAWLHRYMETLTEYLERLLARVLETGVQAIQIDESWVGVGLSPKTYNEFVLPYDRRLVEMAHRAGVLVDYHNCGRARAILEPMADTGADALEPLTPPALNGDTALAEAKRRIGGRMALYGGMNERVLMESPDEVRTEVRRCIDEGAAGGGYAIRTAGQVFEADLRNLEVMSEAAHRYGTY